MRVPQLPTLPLSDREITMLSRLLFALPECDSLFFTQFLLLPPSPLRILLLLQINNNKVGKGLSYSENCPVYRSFTTPLGRSQADRLPHTFTWLQCPFKSVTPDHCYSAIPHSYKPTKTHSLLNCCLPSVPYRWRMCFCTR